MLLLSYAGMADLYTGAVQRRVTTIAGFAAGSFGEPVDDRSWYFPQPGLAVTGLCPWTMQPAACHPVPAAECSRRFRPARCARRARHRPLVCMRWPVSAPRARAGECAASSVRSPGGQLSVISPPDLALRSANYLRGTPVADPPGGDHQVSGS
jgi:hypothetical protein